MIRRNKKQVEKELVAKEVFEESKIRNILFLISIIFLSFFLGLISNETFFYIIIFFLLLWNFYSIKACDRKIKLVLKKTYSKEIKSETKEEQNRKSAFLELKKLKNKMLKGRRVSEKELKFFIQKHFKDKGF